MLASFISLAVLGYSINTFTLFGLVLVIGTVVDDAIVVVERVLYVMEHEGLPPAEATERAMKDVSGPMIATTLVFLAIFVPVTMIEGITGEIYRQFGVTMSFAVVCSTLVAFTLSPAMCANLFTNIKPKTRGPLAWFNKSLELCTNGEEKTVLSYDEDTRVMTLDRDKTGAGGKGIRQAELTPFDILKLRIFLDKSSIEIFVNGGEFVFSTRVYPRAESDNIVFVPQTETLEIASVDFYKLK